MITPSEAFRTAYANGAPQRMAFRFTNGTIVSNEDIDIEAGVSFNEIFCSETDLAIGLCPSSEISFTLLNDDGYYNNFTYGQFTAYLGVLTGTTITTNSSTTPTPETTQTSNDWRTAPTNVKAVLSADGTKAVISWTGNDLCTGYAIYEQLASGYKVVGTVTGADITTYTTKALEDGTHIFYVKPRNGSAVGNASETVSVTIGGGDSSRPVITINGETMTVSGNGKVETYAIIPMGTFIALKPSIVDKVEIAITANDLMTLFEQDMPSATALGISYPVTAKDLLDAMCEFVGVETTADTFINSTLTLSTDPSTDGDKTMREVLSWIAEIACANARFNRAGKLELVWLNQVDKSYDESAYTQYESAWYEAGTISKLHTRNADSTAESTLGSGTQGYMIQDNPFLRIDDTPTPSSSA